MEETYLYQGWMKKQNEPTTACRFETIAKDLKIGNTLTDAFGVVWLVDCITYDGKKEHEHD